MPRFFIHVENDNGLERDLEGSECVDLAAARRAAIRAGADIIADELTQGCTSVALTIYIDDEAGKRLATLPMSASAQG